jgi:hypothetical protein
VPHNEEPEGYVERSGDDPEKGLKVPTYGDEEAAGEGEETEEAGYPYPKRQSKLGMSEVKPPAEEGPMDREAAP